MITTTVTGLDKAIANFNEDMANGLTSDILDTAKNYTLGQVMKYTPVDTGRLRASWPLNTTVTPLSVDIKSIVEYSPYVEYDTVPHWPPIKALAGWGKRHGISPYAIAAKIAKYGTKGKHMAEKAAKDLRDNMDNITKIALTKWLGRFKS